MDLEIKGVTYKAKPPAPESRPQPKDFRQAGRQQVRRRMFQLAYEVLNERYGGEPRRRKRAMARVISQREWRERPR